MSGLPERLGDGGQHTVVHGAFVGKLDLHLLGVYIGVDSAGVHIHKQDANGVTAARQTAVVGFFQGDLKHAGTHIAPGHEKDLLLTAGARDLGGAAQAVHMDAALEQRNGQHLSCEGFAEDGAHRLWQIARAGCAQAVAPVLLIREGKSGTREGEFFQKAADDGGLGAVLFEKFLARRRVEKEIAHGDFGAHRAAARRGGEQFSALDHHFKPLVAVRLAGAQRHFRDGGNRGQRLAAKAERAD